MIRLPAVLFGVLVLAVSAECKRKAFNANMFRAHGIGRRQWMEDYDKLKKVMEMLQGLALEMRNRKAKFVRISIDSLVAKEGV